jgi:hypothetical protein
MTFIALDSPAPTEVYQDLDGRADLTTSRRYSPAPVTSSIYVEFEKGIGLGRKEVPA